MYTYMSGYGKEEVVIPKGQLVTGDAIGIIRPGCWWYPRIPGDTGNATTFNFPVYYKILKGTTPEEIMTTEPNSSFLKKTIEAGKELVEQGCRAIIGNCGYFANYLTEVAAALDVPCFLSSLMQVPIISRALKPSQKVCIICANGRVLESAPALKQCGVDDLSKVVIVGAENLPEFQPIAFNLTGHFTPAKLEQELVGLAKQAVSKHPDIGAIMLECTALPPYAWAIQEAVKLPVFDYTTMINWVYNAVVRRPFAGFM